MNGKLVHNPLLANENNLEKRRQFYSNEKLLHLIWNEKLFCYLWSMLIPKNYLKMFVFQMVDYMKMKLFFIKYLW